MASMHWFWRTTIATAVAVATGGLFVAVNYFVQYQPRSIDSDIGFVIIVLTVTSFVGIIAYTELSARLSIDSPETRCRRCGYILRGISEPRCPECGERI